MRPLWRNSMKINKILNSATPSELYHGSGYKQEELKPGYQHSKKLTVWDQYESNAYLYATSNRDSAMLLGFSSAIEKKYKLNKTKIDEAKKTIYLEFGEPTPSLDNLFDTEVYLYSIPYDSVIWQKNNNPFNNIDTEYKTTSTITKINDREQLNLHEVLSDYQIQLNVT